MRKIYLLSLLCLMGFAAGAQTTVTIWASGASGTYTTGYATPTVRGDGNININSATPEGGYAVFDLTSIPAGSAINSVTLGVYVQSAGGVGTPGTTTTYGYAGDLSTVTTPATLYADLTAGTSLSTTSYGTTTGNLTITPPTSFFQIHAGSKVSMCFTGGSPRNYVFSSETGSTVTTTTAFHAPYLTITYCPPPTGVTASATPSTLCAGDVLTLTGSATGATSYSWTGPGGYSAGGTTNTLTATTASSGTYVFTAINSCTTFSATVTTITGAVTVNATPSAITGATAVCTGASTALTSSPPGGNWTSSNPSSASVGISTGIVTGLASGTATISYMLSSGCYVTSPMAVNDPPTAIFGPSSVCVGSTIVLGNGSPGGTWTSSAPGTATVGASSGIVTGISPGTTATISYVTNGCTSVSYPITVNALPNPIGGPSNVCVGASVTETESTFGGTWSTSNPVIAVVSGGVVTGMSTGAVNVIYTLSSTGCAATKVMAVNPLPGAITGPTTVCENGGTISVSDPTPGGFFSGGLPNATVSPGGTVTGSTAGAATITYSLASTCYVTESIIVNPVPSPVTGTFTVCQNSTTTLSDPDVGGSWSSAATGTATVGSLTGIVSGVAGGTVNISYRFPTGCAAVAPVTVNAAPSTVVTASGPTTFCAGNSVTLSVPFAAGNVYQWNLGGVPIPGETNAAYLASTSGAFTVDVTNSLGCTATSAITNVTAGFTATITNATPLGICIGNSVVLTASVGSAIGSLSYQWLYNGAVIPFANSVNYTASAAGAYRVAVTISGGSGLCTDTAAAVNVTVNALPTPSITTVGAAFATVGTYATYQWYLNGTAITGATNATYTPIVNGWYRVRVGDAIGCQGYSNQIEKTGVGVQNVNMPTVGVYPNPANDMVHVICAFTLRATITAIDGKVLIDQPDAKAIDIHSLASGVYILSLYDETGKRLKVEKLVKE